MMVEEKSKAVSTEKSGLFCFIQVIFLDFYAVSRYNRIRIFDCHRVVSESACLHIVRSWKMCGRGLIFCFGGFMKTLTTYFSKGELTLWGSSAGLILVSFFLFDRVNFMTLAASLAGSGWRNGR